MSSKKPQEKSRIDWLKWAVGIAILVVAVAGDVYLANSWSGPVRAAGIIILVIAALLVLKTTQAGGRSWKFLQDARMEARKVVWPTRQQTLQSTLLVVVVVTITALILWGVDGIYALLVGHFII